MTSSCAVLSADSDLFLEICSYLTGGDLLKIFTVCSEWKQKISTSEILWKAECKRLDFVKSLGTRSRDTRSWLQLYKSMQCLNCYDADRGAVQLTAVLTNYRSNRPVLCVSCFCHVRQYRKFSDRLKQCLLRLRDKTHPYNTHRSFILMTVPTDKRGKLPGPNDVDFDGVFHNDYLTNKLKKIRR